MELKDQLEKGLEQLGEKIEAKCAEAVELAKNSAAEKGDKISADFKAEIKALTEKYAKTAEQVNQLDVDYRKNGFQGKGMTYSEALKGQLQKSEGFNSFKSKTNRSARVDLKGFNLLYKADMDSDTNLVDATGVAVIPPTRVPGVFYTPDRPQHVRQFLPIGTTSSNKIEYLQETAITDATASTAEGAAFPQSEVTVTAVRSDVEKIGTRLDFTEEMLEDWDQFTSYLSVRFGKKVLVREDQQLLYGTGTSPQLQGISGVASAFNPPNATLGSAVQEIDVLNQAVSQIRQDEYMANAIMLNPADVHNIFGLKDADNNYLYGGPILAGSPLVIAGVPVIGITAVTSGDFFVGDFNLGCQLFDRKMPEIEFSYENQDNFEKDRVTAKIRERIAFPIYRTDAFVYGDFASAKANYSV